MVEADASEVAAVEATFKKASKGVEEPAQIVVVEEGFKAAAEERRQTSQDLKFSGT